MLLSMYVSYGYEVVSQSVIRSVCFCWQTNSSIVNGIIMLKARKGDRLALEQGRSLSDVCVYECDVMCEYIVCEVDKWKPFIDIVIMHRSVWVVVFLLSPMWMNVM
jgi:hypothetical protein